jgi:hypothetical protein
MSEENVELARAALDAFNRGDLEWRLKLSSATPCNYFGRALVLLTLG